MIPGWPADWMLQAIVATVRERLVDRPMMVRIGEFDARLTLRDVVAAPGAFGLMVGQLDDVHLIAEDITWRNTRFERLVVSCHNVSLRAGLGVTVVAAPVDIELVISGADLESWSKRELGRVRLTVGEDGVARAALARRPRLGHLELDHDLDGDVLRLIPRSLVVLGRRIPAGWLPQRRVRHPALSPGMHVAEVATGRNEVVVRMTVDEWRHQLSPGLLPELLRRVRGADDRLDVPLGDPD